MRRGTRSQATNTGLMSLAFMIINQIRRMDEKPPVTIALVAGDAHESDQSSGGALPAQCSAAVLMPLSAPC